MWLDLFVEGRSRRTASDVYEQVRTAIATGRLRAGDRLPPTRALALELGVARSTVSAVYARLVAEGFLDGRQGDGTFVAAPFGASEQRPPAHTDPTGPTRTVTGAAATPPALVADLRSGRPDPSLFPRVDWRRCATLAAAEPPPDYGDAAGLPALRRNIAGWVARSRGVTAAPAQVLVTAGAQQAFDLIAARLLRRGAVIACEDPGYPPARRAFERHGVRVAPVPVDEQGVIVDAIPPDVAAVYVTPSHQAPTGVTMSAGRRRALLDLARARDLLVIEDDYDTEFRYVQRPLEPLQLLDRDGRVLYLGTFSKMLSPSVRLGFVIAPEHVVDALCDERSTVDVQPPHLTQATLAELIGRGAFDRHLRRARREYRLRHELVARELGSLHADDLIASPSRSNAGLHTMLPLHRGSDAADLASRLAERGVAIHSTDEWCVSIDRPGLLVGFGLADIAALDAAFVVIRDQLAARRTAARGVSGGSGARR